MPLFLDQEKPISTCKQSSCNNCESKKSLVCHFKFQHLLLFLTAAFPLFIFSGYFVFQYSVWVFTAWLIWALLYFGLIEIRVMCSHCPHYAEPGISTLKCWANYGMFKFWKYRPGPMNFREKLIFHIGMITMMLVPPVVFAIQMDFLKLGIFIILLGIGIFVLRTRYCSRCMNFACPFNRISLEKRKAFFRNNPVVAEAWGFQEDNPDY